MQGYLMIDKDANVKFVEKLNYSKQRDNGWSRRLLFKSHLMMLIEDLQKLDFKIARINFDNETASKIFKIILGKDDLKDVQRSEMIADFLKTHKCKIGF